MSPQWRDEVYAYIGLTRFAVTRVRRGLNARPEPIEERSIAVTDLNDSAAAMAALSEATADARWQGCPWRIILSDAWVKYAVVPAPGIRLDADGRLHHAKFVLNDRYGGAVSDWFVTLSDAPPGNSYLACAISEEIRIALMDVMETAEITVASVQPSLIVAFNAWRPSMPVGDQWFVHVDDGCVSVAHVLKGEWLSATTTRLTDDWVRDLTRLYKMGSMGGAGASAVGMQIDAPAAMRNKGRQRLPALQWLEPLGSLATRPEFLLMRRVIA